MPTAKMARNDYIIAPFTGFDPNVVPAAWWTYAFDPSLSPDQIAEDFRDSIIEASEIDERVFSNPPMFFEVQTAHTSVFGGEEVRQRVIDYTGNEALDYSHSDIAVRQGLYSEAGYKLDPLNPQKRAPAVRTLAAVNWKHAK